MPRKMISELLMKYHSSSASINFPQNKKSNVIFRNVKVHKYSSTYKVYKLLTMNIYCVKNRIYMYNNF